MTGTPRDDLARFLRDDLQQAADGREDVAYEQVEAYVDGMLDDVDREIFETRLADDPGLRAMVDDLRALRTALPAAAAAHAPVVAFEPRAAVAPGKAADRSTSSRRWLLPAGLSAAAAVALLLWRPWTPAPAPPSQAHDQPRPSTPPASATPAAPASPALALALRDRGRTVGLTSDGTLAGFDGFGSALQARLTETLRQGRLPASPRAAEAVARAGELMSGQQLASESGASFAPVSPMATAVSSATPAFQWTALRGATAYRVRVVDDRLVTVAVSDPVTTLTWRPAAPLPTRRVLSWQVEATTPDGARTTPAPPLPEARFTVLTPSERATVSEALTTAGGSDLASAVVYAEAGLYDDANRALSRVMDANPASAVPGALKADLLRRRFGRADGR